MSEEVHVVDDSFYGEVTWDKITYNKISKEDYLKIKARYDKLYATFLGPSETPAFYMFRPLTWGMYKEIRAKSMDKDTTHEYILNTCVVYPSINPIEISNVDAGIMLTLVYQIMAVSNFLSDPSKSLELIYEI